MWLLIIIIPPSIAHFLEPHIDFGHGSTKPKVERNERAQEDGWHDDDVAH